jgi:hypothetical protein
MYKYAAKLSQKKIGELKKEMGRAHLIIAMLAAVLIILLLIGTAQPLTYNLILTVITSALLLVVVFISLSVAAVFLSKKK